MAISSALIQKVIAGKVEARPLKDFGLKGRASVYIAKGSCIKLIDRSSRVLRKDADTFLNELKVISEEIGQKLNGHILVRRAPICSKAKAHLEAVGVEIEAID